jgi:hypothetical protein
VDEPTDLIVTADERIKNTLFSFFSDICAKPLKCRKFFIRVVPTDPESTGRGHVLRSNIMRNTSIQRFTRLRLY